MQFPLHIAAAVFITLHTEFSTQHVLIKSLGDLLDIVLVTWCRRGNFMANLFVTSVSKGGIVATLSSLSVVPARLSPFGSNAVYRLLCYDGILEGFMITCFLICYIRMTITNFTELT